MQSGLGRAPGAIPSQIGLTAFVTSRTRPLALELEIIIPAI